MSAQNTQRVVGGAIFTGLGRSLIGHLPSEHSGGVVLVGRDCNLELRHQVGSGPTPGLGRGYGTGQCGPTSRRILPEALQGATEGQRKACRSDQGCT